MNRSSLRSLVTYALSFARRAQTRRRAAGPSDSVAQRLRTACWTMRYGLILSLACFSPYAHAQTNTCGAAVAQLQNYATQVNAFAAQYYQRIPMNCGGNPNCMQWSLGQLNSWYMQQTASVNGWYGQLIQQCTQQRTSGRIPSKQQTIDEPGELDTSAIEDLRDDDEDKTVRIRIP